MGGGGEGGRRWGNLGGVGPTGKAMLIMCEILGERRGGGIARGFPVRPGVERPLCSCSEKTCIDLNCLFFCIGCKFVLLHPTGLGGLGLDVTPLSVPSFFICEIQTLRAPACGDDVGKALGSARRASTSQ